MATKKGRQQTGRQTRPHQQAAGPPSDAPAKARRRRPPLLAIVGVAALILLAATALVPHGSPTKALACAGKDVKTGLAVGQCAPDFTLSNLQGRRVSLASYRGHPVLLHFWAVACITCKAEYPDFSRAVRTYTPKGLAVVAVDAWGESPPMIQGWQDTHHLAATLLVDTSQAVPSSLSERSLSALFITLREGKSASVARSLASKRSPSALSLGKYVLSDKLLACIMGPPRPPPTSSTATDASPSARAVRSPTTTSAGISLVLCDAPQATGLSCYHGRVIQLERMCEGETSMATVCPNCGAPVSPGAEFCGNCGQRLAGAVRNASGNGGYSGYGAQGGGSTGAYNEPVPQQGDPQGVLRSGDIAVRIEGELVPVVDVELGGRENIYFEHHVLLWKQPQVNIGLKQLKGAVKRVFAGLQIFVTQAAGPGNISFSRDAPGQIVALQLQPGEEIHVREHQFLLATDGVAYDFFRVKGVANILFGGTGFFIDRFVSGGGAGLLLVHGYGNVFTKVLAPGESIDVEPGAFLWKDASVQLNTSVTNLSTGLFGGTSFTLNRFTGPGRLGIQSMTYHEPINADAGQRSSGINLGGLLNT